MVPVSHFWSCDQLGVWDWRSYSNQAVVLTKEPPPSRERNFSTNHELIAAIFILYKQKDPNINIKMRFHSI